MRQRDAVLGVAVGAGLLRLPWADLALQPDEAGLVLVARSADPGPESLYGLYFLDRPPPLVAVFVGLAALESLGGPVAMRVAGSVVCAVAVVLAAVLARLVAGSRAVLPATLLVAALGANPALNAVAVRAELLALPLVLGSVTATVLAVRRRSPTLALVAGLTAASALLLKQSLVGALAFLVVALAVHWHRRRDDADGHPGPRLVLAATAGAAVPVVATVAWAVAHDVALDTLWYAVAQFRSDATSSLLEAAGAAPDRGGELLVVGLVCGTGAVLLWFGARLPQVVRAEPTLGLAAAALVASDLTALVLSGSYWRSYLVALIPASVVALVLGLAAPATTTTTTTTTSRFPRGAALVLANSVLACVVAVAGLSVARATGRVELDEARTGAALGAAAEPTDTLVVFGGRPDLQLHSGLSSPYPHLWSLPMRTRDVGYRRLLRLLRGAEPPTWVAESADFQAWGGGRPADRVEQVVLRRYRLHAIGCGDEDRRIYLLRGVRRPPLALDCG